MKMRLIALALAATAGAVFLGWPKHNSVPEFFEEEAAPVASSSSVKNSTIQKASLPAGSGMKNPESALGEREALSTAQARAHWDAISNLVECANSRKCDEVFPDTDPSSHFFAVRDRMLDEIDWFMERAAVSPAQIERSVKAAQYLLAVPDEMVQGRALEWLLQHPADEKTPSMIAENMPDVVDAGNAALIAKNLARFNQAEYAALIGDYISDKILNGATFSSVEFARNIGLVLNEHNRSRFERLLKELPKGQREAFVRNALYPRSAST